MTHGTQYTTRIIEGRFPNYKEIIPKDVKTEVVILKNDFNDILRKARVFSGSEQYIQFHIYPSKKICSVTSQSAVVGEMSDILDVAMNGEDLDIKFNTSYLGDCVSSINSDSLVLKFAGVGRPVIIQGVSDQSFRYLVMPMNR
jgi:DNA polymerase-3 subunit beta